MSYHVKISANGRMSLPADLRKRLGLDEGGDLTIEETPNALVIRTVAQAVANAQALARRYTGDKPTASVDGFLAARRKEWGE